MVASFADRKPQGLWCQTPMYVSRKGHGSCDLANPSATRRTWGAEKPRTRSAKIPDRQPNLATVQPKSSEHGGSVVGLGSARVFQFLNGRDHGVHSRLIPPHVRCPLLCQWKGRSVAIAEGGCRTRASPLLNPQDITNLDSETEPPTIDRFFDFSQEPLRDLESLAARLRDLGCQVVVNEELRLIRVTLKKPNRSDCPADL